MWDSYQYIPDTARAIHGVLQEIKRRKTGAEPATGSIAEQEVW